MPLGDSESRERVRDNLVIRNYPSGHMIYLDNDSRKAMKEDLAKFYNETQSNFAVSAADLASKVEDRISLSPYRRRFNRTPY